MRVGLDARLAGPGLGVATLIQALARELPTRGLEVVWFGESTLAPDSVSAVVTPPRPGFAGLDSPLGHRCVERAHVDVMHFAANSGWWKSGPVPHIVTVHDLMWGQVMRGRTARQLAGHSYLRFSVPRAIAGAAVVAAPSQITAAAVRRRYSAPARIIHNGVGDDWRRAASDPHDPPYVVAFSGRDPRKATEVALDAWVRVAGSGVRLVLLAGAGIPRRLHSRIEALQATGGIDVLPYQPAARVIEIVAQALALLYPSADEGFGLPVAEAMAAGVPVITGRAAVTREIGGEAILTIGADPAADAARHLERLLREPELRRSLANRGRRRAEAFTWDRAISGYIQAYAEAAKR